MSHSKCDQEKLLLNKRRAKDTNKGTSNPVVKFYRLK